MAVPRATQADTPGGMASIGRARPADQVTVTRDGGHIILEFFAAPEPAGEDVAERVTRVALSMEVATMLRAALAGQLALAAAAA